MRGGPGLGNIDPTQSEYFQATKGGGHGDYHSIVLAPLDRAGGRRLDGTSASTWPFATARIVIVAADGTLAESWNRWRYAAFRGGRR